MTCNTAAPSYSLLCDLIGTPDRFPADPPTAEGWYGPFPTAFSWRDPHNRASFKNHTSTPRYVIDVTAVAADDYEVTIASFDSLTDPAPLDTATIGFSSPSLMSEFVRDLLTADTGTGSTLLEVARESL